MKASTNDRIAYLDGLRGLAALAVAVLHIFYDRGTKAFAAPVVAIIQHGSLGVELFFVVSGFVIARVLGARPLDGPTARRFIVKRVVRLDPPYWVSIALVTALIAVSNLVLPDRHAEPPSPSLIAAHLLYLQEFLGLPHIIPVYWTLCFEIQFYLLLMLSFALRQWWLRRPGSNEQLVDGVVFGLPAVFSLLSLAGVLPVPRGACFDCWCLFLSGVLVERYCSGQLRLSRLVIFLGALVAVAVAFRDLRAAVAAATAASIAIGHRHQLLHRWLAGPRLQYLGKVSYSLYLTHPIVGQHLPNLGHRLTGDGPVWVVVWGVVGLTAAIGASHLFWRWVEVPSIALSRILSSRRWIATAHPNDDVGVTPG